VMHIYLTIFIKGGSSGANAMIFFRGSVRDFDIWENEYKLDGWGFDDVMPFFKKFENNEDVKNSPIHGYSGPINISTLFLFLFLVFIFYFLCFCFFGVISSKIYSYYAKALPKSSY
jgi:hypothetical protein